MATAFRDTTPAQHGKHPPWQPGQSGNPLGRPRGARNKLGEIFLENLFADFKEHGVQAIIDARAESPTQYIKTIASLMPKEIDAGERLLDALGELLSRVDGRTRTIAPVIEGEVRRIDAPTE